MDLMPVIQLLGLICVIVTSVVGVGMRIERRLSRIEAKLGMCPHVDLDKSREVAEIRG